MTTHSWNGYNRQPGGRIDVNSGAAVGISAEHWVIHQGLSFHTGHRFAGVTTTSARNILIKVPADTYPHLHFMSLYAGRGDVDLELFEDTTVSADGTAMPLVNLNRNSSNVAGTTVFHTPTITADGDSLGESWMPPTSTGQGQSEQGIIYSSEGIEWILKPSTNYLLRMINSSGDTIDMMARFMIYELNGD